MSIGPLSLPASVAGAPLAQNASAETERAQQTTQQARQTASTDKADAAAGIGETDGENTSAHERDADGRRLWEAPAGPGKQPVDAPADSETPLARDPDGVSGSQLDLSG